jgi:peptide chain release factor 3
LDCFYASYPRPKESETRLVDPKEEKCQGLCLKSMPIWTLNIEIVAFIKLFLELLKETLLPCTSKEFKILKSNAFFAEKKK